MATAFQQPVLLICLLASVGCDQAFTKKPQTADLAGTYQLSKGSTTFLLRRKAYKTVPVSTITLGTNSHVTILNLPDCATNGFGDSRGAFISGGGTWEVERGSPGWVVTLDIDKSGSLHGGVYAGQWMAIRGKSQPYRLEVTIGDPDSGETIVYERAGN